MNRNQSRLLHNLAVVAALLGAGACGDDDKDKADGSTLPLDGSVDGSLGLPDAGTLVPDATVPVGDGSVVTPPVTMDAAVTAPVDAGKPVFVVSTQVRTPDDRIIYVSTHDSLSADSAKLVKGAREFPSVANFETIAGKLYISSGEASTITKFEVGEDLAWKEIATLDFSNFETWDNANLQGQYVIDATRVFFPYATNKHVIWNPTTMELGADFTDTKLPLKEGDFNLQFSGNGTRAQFKNGVVLTPFFHESDDGVLSQNSFIAVYDDKFAESKVLTIPCPELGATSRAEDGTTYFSNQYHSGLHDLFGLGLKPCVARVTAAGEVDTAFTTDFKGQTGGRYVQNFVYMRDGKAIGSVLYADRLKVDFSTGAYDPDLREKLIDEEGFYQLWLFDLKTNTAKEITGVDKGVTARNVTTVVDGRMLVRVATGDGTSTRVYEVSDNAVATKLFDAEGTVKHITRLR